MKIALYCRVSTADQDCSLQLRELRAYAAARGWEIVGEYVDTGWSGAKASRPELNRLLKDAKQRKCDAIAVWKLDRLGRSLQHLIQCVNDFSSWGVRFIAVTQSIDTDQNNPTSRLLLNMLGVLAEFERDLIRERVLAGLATARAKGVQLGRRSNVWDRQQAVDLHRQGKSIRKIADALGVKRTTVERALKERGRQPAPARDAA